MESIPTPKTHIEFDDIRAGDLILAYYPSELTIRGRVATAGIGENVVLQRYGSLDRGGRFVLLDRIMGEKPTTEPDHTAFSDPIRDRIAAIIGDYDDFGREQDQKLADQILREFAVLHRSEETIFTEECFLHCGDGPTHVAVESTQDPRIVRNRAANLLAIADYLAAEAVLAEAKRNKRRDELALELSEGMEAYGWKRDYEGLSSVAKKAIDRIIEIEAAL